MTVPMRILVVGGGGGEHALCWRIRRDRPQAEIFAAPGNGGTAELATNVPLRAADVAGVTAWCDEHGPDLVVIGPDDPLPTASSMRCSKPASTSWPWRASPPSSRRW